MYDMEGVQGSRHIRELFGGSVLETGKSVYRDNLNMLASGAGSGGEPGFENLFGMSRNHGRNELPPVSWTSKLKSREWEAFHVCGFAVEA